MVWCVWPSLLWHEEKVGSRGNPYATLNTPKTVQISPHIAPLPHLNIPLTQRCKAFIAFATLSLRWLTEYFLYFLKKFGENKKRQSMWSLRVNAYASLARLSFFSELCCQPHHLPNHRMVTVYITTTC